MLNCELRVLALWTSLVRQVYSMWFSEAVITSRASEKGFWCPPVRVLIANGRVLCLNCTDK